MLPATSVGNPDSFRISPGQRRRRGLAVGAGDGQDLALQKTRGQFQLADHRAAEVAGLHQFRRIQRHAGAHHDQVLAAEGQQAVAAGLHHDALFEQRRNLLWPATRPSECRKPSPARPAGAKTAPPRARTSPGPPPELFCLSVPSFLLALEAAATTSLCTAGGSPRAVFSAISGW